MMTRERREAVATLATERDFAALGIARDWFAVRRAALSGAEEGSLDRYLVGRWARPREAPERPGTSKDGGDNAKDELAQLNRHLRGAQRCSLLGPGSAFVGSQVFSNNPAHGRDERWKVSVRITEADVERGLLRGVMDAVNQHPGGTSGVSTFWEGEVLDGDRVGLLTGRLGATAQVDRVHWARFPPVERMLARIRAGEDPDPTDLSRYLLMRWKETFFVASPSECALTIAGFYYICFDRVTGAVDGYYFDPRSNPFQRLQLRRSAPSSGVMSLGACESL